MERREKSLAELLLAEPDVVAWLEQEERPPTDEDDPPKTSRRA